MCQLRSLFITIMLLSYGKGTGQELAKAFGDTHEVPQLQSNDQQRKDEAKCIYIIMLLVEN